ncbi:GTP-binding protein [Methylocystis sp.]|uniref:CobW family GTP-binding protein n=1 Tax=Methylocystis sp. TaxID=1911079 RepID=UPI0027334434|nr:GTP-binding protein [Methylocystis sp.]MDP3553278.1 GTP-binding protein [Methylocystis sp.]
MTDVLPQIMPVVLVTGFLGAGKTTLLNACLDGEAFRDTAVIVNEFGDISVDHDLVRAGSREMMITTTGCICCTASSDVRVSLFELLEASRTGEIPPFSRVVIETTGLADPAPIVNALTPGAAPAFGMRDHVVARRFRLASIIACVDVVTGDGALNNAFEAMKQVAFASSILLTKTDLVPKETSPEHVARLRARLASINPSAEIAERTDVGAFFAHCFKGGYAPNLQADDVIGWLALDRLMRSNGGSGPSAGPAYHRDDIRATALMHDGSMTRAALDLLLNVLVKTAGAQLLRVKGLVRLSDDQERPMVVHAVQHLMHPPTQLASWPSEDRRTKLVVIGRGHDEKALISLFETLVDYAGRPPVIRGWRGPAIAAAGFATMVAALVLFYNAAPSTKPAPQVATQAIGGPR